MYKIVIQLLFSAFVLAYFSVSIASEEKFTQTGEFDIPEAHQGVGVDADHFYAVDNRSIAKYTKAGELVAKWEGSSDGPIIHLDSAVVIHGKIFAAHSNYRFLPMTSSIEVFDAETLQPIESHSLGIRLGSLTWIDWHDGHWWGTFANYDNEARNPDGTNAGVPYGGKINTTLVKFDRRWRVLQGWIFPVELLDQFGDMSNSGGSWGPDGFLYLTGHDLPLLYKVKIPDAGSILEVVETFPLNVRGQGIAWDRSNPGVLYGIIRANDEEEAAGQSDRVVVFDSPLQPTPSVEIPLVSKQP